MSYGKTWNQRANKAARQQWCRDDNLEMLIRYLEGIKFSLQTQRDSAADEIAKLLLEHNIAGPKKQFGLDEWTVYYNLNYECINQHFAQIRNSISYKPPENAFMISTDRGKTAVSDNSSTVATGSQEKDKGETDRNDASKIKDISEREKFEKSRVAFYKGLEALRNSLGTFDCGMARDEFESKFNLKWS